MRKLISTSLLMFITSCFICSNAADTFIAGFEDGETGYTTDGWYQGYTMAITDNTETSGINNSDKCLMATVTGANPDRWGLWVHVTLDNPVTITADNRYFKVMVKRTPNNVNLALSIDQGDPDPWGTGFYFGQAKPPKAGVWGDIVFDLFNNNSDKSCENKQVQKFLICLGTWDGTEPGVCMLDNVALSDNSKPRGAYEVPSGLLVNFEDEALTAANFSGFEVQTANASAQVVNNPKNTSVNPSAKSLVYNKPAKDTWWYSLMGMVNGIIPVQYPNSYLHMMMYIPDASPVTIMVNSANKSLSEKVYPADGEGWYDYVIDVSELDYITQINFRFNQTQEENWDNPAGQYYVDDFVLDSNYEPRAKINTSIPKVSMENLKLIARNGQLQLISDDMKTVVVYSVTGQQVDRQMAKGSIVNINLSTGMYIFKVENKAGEVAAFKFVMK